MDKWKSHVFRSSTRLTSDFKEFAKDYKKFVKSNIPEGAKISNFCVGHFDCCGFIVKSGKYVYFSTGDVRTERGYGGTGILIREARNDNDFTGFSNHFTTIDNFSRDVKILLGA